jgi:hypothetical protein
MNRPYFTDEERRCRYTDEHEGVYFKSCLDLSMPILVHVKRDYHETLGDRMARLAKATACFIGRNGASGYDAKRWKMVTFREFNDAYLHLDFIPRGTLL